MSTANFSSLHKASAAWAPSLPDWIEALARACDASSQRGVAAVLGVSPAVINLLVNNKYAPRDHRRAELRVRQQLMSDLVDCPALGSIPREQCLQEQRKPLNVYNPAQVQVYRACRRGCPALTEEDSSKQPANAVQAMVNALNTAASNSFRRPQAGGAVSAAHPGRPL